MSILCTMARNIFGSSIEVIDLKIAFHKDANPFGTHGILKADHVDQKLKDHPVRFVFIGASKPPVLTPRILSYLWEEARAQGYQPQSLESYGTPINIISKVSVETPVVMDRCSIQATNADTIRPDRLGTQGKEFPITNDVYKPFSSPLKK